MTACRRRERERERVLSALHAATDVYTWKLLRRDIGLSQAETAATMTMLVEGVLPDGDEHRPLSRREGNTMAKYLFAVWDGGGSAPPELAVAQQLVERGHDVVVLADPVLEDDVLADRQPLPAVGAGDGADQPATGGRPDQGLGVQDADQPLPPRRGPPALRAGARLRGRHRGRHRRRARPTRSCPASCSSRCRSRRRPPASPSPC